MGYPLGVTVWPWSPKKREEGFMINVDGLETTSKTGNPARRA